MEPLTHRPPRVVQQQPRPRPLPLGPAPQLLEFCPQRRHRCVPRRAQPRRLQLQRLLPLTGGGEPLGLEGGAVRSGGGRRLGVVCRLVVGDDALHGAAKAGGGRRDGLLRKRVWVRWSGMHAHASG